MANGKTVMQVTQTQSEWNLKYNPNHSLIFAAQPYQAVTPEEIAEYREKYDNQENPFPGSPEAMTLLRIISGLLIEGRREEAEVASPWNVDEVWEMIRVSQKEGRPGPQYWVSFRP